MQDRFNGLTQEYLKSILHYNPETGVWIWLVQISNRIVVGDIAGSIDSYGYVQIKIDRFGYKAHRLACFYMTGWWPKDQIDHENRIRHDNRWINLREATQSQNARNKSVAFSKISELKGAYELDGVWYSFIMIDRKRVSLGSFKSEIEAHNAYIKAAHLHFKEFATSGVVWA